MELRTRTEPIFLREQRGWPKISFGEWRDNPRSLPYIAFLNPSWLCWAFQEGALDFRPRAEEAYLKARRIRIPQSGDERLVAEYGLDPMTGKFTCLELVPAGMPEHEGGTVTVRGDVLDLGYVHALGRRDDLGQKMLVRAIRRIVMPGVKRLTAEIAEAFFDDDDNFDLEAES